MADLKSVNINLHPLSSENVEAQSCVSYNVNTKETESLNNACDNSEAQSLMNSPVSKSNNGSGTLRKVPNKNSPGSYKKPTITLSHLPRRPPVDIQFNDLSYSVSEGRKRGYKTILKCVNGTFKSGELTAIMGPSGAGKSTLMNILAGYKTSNLTGSVLINGKDRSLRRFRKMSCYIMQDDCLSPHLTVKEALNVSANLKLGKSVSRAEKKIVVNEVIEALGLQECVENFTSTLSGGQKKRLSIALEMVNNPPVMFFDEPTSGLDSSTCFQCLCLLKSLARGGRTVICTIHQPSARLFEMFDHLFILAEGQCIYRGMVKGLVPFLSSMGLNCPSYHNPADYVMEVASGEHGDYVQKLVVAVNSGRCNKILTLEAQPEGKKISNDITKENTTIHLSPEMATQNGVVKNLTPPTCTTSLLDSSDNLPQVGLHSFPASGLRQFWILLKRTTFIILRDKMLTRLRLASHVVIGILLGLIYYDIGNDAAKVMSNAGCLFFITLFTMFTSMMPTILTFPVEMSVFVREHLNYWYSVKAYYFAKTLADIPFQIVMTMGYVMGVYYLTAQPMEFIRFAMVLIISVATALVGQSFGLLVGAGLNIESGVFLGPISTIPMVLFSGFFANLDDIPYYLKWLPYTSYIKYSFEGTMIAIYGLNRDKLDCTTKDYCHFRYPKRFLDEMSMKDDMNTFLLDVAVLFGLFLLLRFFTYFVLRIKLRQNR